MWGEFHGHTTRELGLKGRAVFFQFVHHGLATCRSQHAEKNVRALQIGGDFDVVDGDKRPFKTDFAAEDSTQFPFYDFVDAQHSTFHVTLSFPSEFWGHRLELIALNDIADGGFDEIAKLNAASQP